MAKCIVTGQDLVDIPDTDQSDTDAHVIPSAFGGRLKPRGILSRKGNNVLDRKIDSPHIQAMQPYMTWLQGSRDRKGAPTPVQMVDENGDRYMVGNGEIKPLDHKYDVKVVDGNIVGTIKAVSEKQMGQLLKRLQKEFNLTDAQMDQVKAQAQKVRLNPGALSRQVIAGPAVEFPSAFAMCAIFSAYHGLPLRSDFNSYIDSFEEDTQPRPLPSDTFYFALDEKWFELEAEIGHCLILFCDPQRKLAIFVSSLFNLPEIAVLMPYEDSEEVLHTYGVDILQGKEVDVSVRLDILRAADWKATHILDEKLWALNQDRGQPLMELSANREFERARREIDDKYIKLPCTKENLKLMYQDYCELLKVAVKPEFREGAIRGLKTRFLSLGMEE